MIRPLRTISILEAVLIVLFGISLFVWAYMMFFVIWCLAPDEQALTGRTFDRRDGQQASPIRYSRGTPERPLPFARGFSLAA